MMIIRPPQRGQGWAKVCTSWSSSSAPGSVLVLGRRHLEQVPGPRQALGAPAIGEQAVVADAVEAQGQDVDTRCPSRSPLSSIASRFMAA